MLIYQTLLYLPAQLLGPVVQFLAAIAWTHWLSPSEFGVVVLVIAAQELVFFICLSWWSQYTTRYYVAHQRDGSTGSYQPTDNTVLVGSAVAQAFVSFGALALSHTALDAGLIVATIVFTVTRSITVHLSERARATGRVAIYTLAQTAGPVLGTVLGFVAIINGHVSATAVLSGFAVAQVLALPVLWHLLGLGSRFGLSRGILSIAIRYGAPLLGAGVVTWFSVNGIRIVVDKIDGAAAVGLVSVGWNLGQRATTTAAMLVTAAAYPLVVRRTVVHSRQAGLMQLSQSGALLMGVLAPVTIGLLMINRAAVELLIGEQFQSLTLVVLPIAVLSGAIRNIRVHYADQTFMLCERTGIALVVCTLEALLTLILCVLGLLHGGLVGACLGCLVAHVLAAIFTFILAVARLHLPVPWMHFGRVAIASAAMTLALASVRWPATPLGLALEVLCGAMAYLAAAALIYRRQLQGLLAGWFANAQAPAE